MIHVQLGHAVVGRAGDPPLQVDAAIPACWPRGGGGPRRSPSRPRADRARHSSILSVQSRNGPWRVLPPTTTMAAQPVRRRLPTATATGTPLRDSPISSGSMNTQMDRLTMGRPGTGMPPRPASGVIESISPVSQCWHGPVRPWGKAVADKKCPRYPAFIDQLSHWHSRRRSTWSLFRPAAFVAQ